MDTNERVMIGIFAVAYLGVCVLAVAAIGSPDTQSDAITASATLVGVLIGLVGSHLIDTHRQSRQDETVRLLRWEASELATVDEFHREVTRVISATARAEALLELDDWDEQIEERFAIEFDRAKEASRAAAELYIYINDPTLRSKGMAVCGAFADCIDETASVETRTERVTALLIDAQGFTDRYREIRQGLMLGNRG